MKVGVLGLHRGAATTKSEIKREEREGEEGEKGEEGRRGRWERERERGSGNDQRGDLTVDPLVNISSPLT